MLLLDVPFRPLELIPGTECFPKPELLLLLDADDDPYPYNPLLLIDSPLPPPPPFVEKLELVLPYCCFC